MKMIAYKKLGCLAIFAALAACSSPLDTEPFDRISEDVVWSNTANAETFIYSTYSITNNFQGGPATDARTTNLLGFDNVYYNDEAVFTERLDRNSDKGFNNWGEVRRCNLIIEKVTASTGIPDEDKGPLIAEAKFLRAMSYFNIARNTGRIAWIDRVLNPDDDMMLKSTANPTETYQYIIQDLKDAVAGMTTSKVPGRANKYVAASMLSEVCLQALAYEHYPNAANVQANDPLLDLAISSAQMVINEGGYSMEANYGSMFNDQNPQSAEIIFGIYRDAINTGCQDTPMQGIVPNIGNDQITQGGGSPLLKSPIRIFEAWVQHGPTQNMAEDYLVKDAANPSLALPWNQTSQYKAAVEEGVTIPTSSIPKANGEVNVQTGRIKSGESKTIWDLNNEGRDSRWEASILSDSSGTFYGETLTTTIKGNANRWLKLNGQAYYLSLSNMYWRKGVYNNVTPRVYVGVPTDYHYVITRLGRVYLNLAEAYLLRGSKAEALAAMNMTRVAHGNLPPSNANSMEDLWADYKRERRVDLVLENDYYWSLLRWGRYGGGANHGLSPGSTIPELTEVPRIMDISKDRKSFAVIRGAFFGSNDVREFNPARRYLFPIAQSYLDRNPNFGPQNPGW